MDRLAVLFFEVLEEDVVAVGDHHQEVALLAGLEGVRFFVYEAGGSSSVVNASFEVDREL
jgi:hypothetical protein